jgi:hypothetical protein
MQRTLPPHHTSTLQLVEDLLASSDPLPQPHSASQEPTGPTAVRILGCPSEYKLSGIPVLCSGCNARRDWLFINQGRHVWIRCRCGHQWAEPEITRADFDELPLHTPMKWTNYPTVTAATHDLGFDGIFGGLYLG